MMQLRWADGGVKCPHCGAERVTYLAKQRVWKCYVGHDRPTFSLKTGTIFEDSPIALEKWLTAAWLIISCKNGISSYEIHRGLGVTQKTAWFMLHRIRLAMQEGGFNKLSGEVEIDETFIGGKARNTHKDKRDRVITGTGGKDKTSVMGMVERGGNVRTMVMDGRRKRELQKQVREHVEAGAAIFTDELKSYDGLEDNFQHAVINHAVEYVNGSVHTNTMENFWSLLKRGLHGTYMSVEPFHLFRYLDEQTFRYNNRKATDAERFSAVMKQIVGRRVTYKELTGKNQEDGRKPLLPESARDAGNDSAS
ncbi:MAG: IS1595 family transposase [Acidobacteriota bacterium]|nr:IS1595 family transposase [Acidobacteriota bacterium]